MKSAFIIAIVTVTMIGIMIPNVFSEISIISDDGVIVEKTITMNLVLVGDEWNTSNVEQIKNGNTGLTDEYILNTLIENKNTGIKYFYEYNFISLSETDSNKLFNFMNNNAIVRDSSNLLFPHKIWIEIFHKDWIEKGNLIMPYESYDVLEIEKYIYDEIIMKEDQLNIPNSINLIFLKGDLSKLNNVHDYTLTSKDPIGRGGIFDSFGLTGYGGNYNFYFFDLYAAVWTDFDWTNYYETLDVRGSWFIPRGMTGLHDCSPTYCLDGIIQNHVNSAIQHIITPSPVYQIDYNDSYLIDIVAYSMPGPALPITDSTIEFFINTKKIKHELESLIPFSEVFVEVSTENQQSRGLSAKFKDSIHSADHISEDIPFSDSNIEYTLLRSEQIKPHLQQWAKERQETSESKVNWVIPVLITIDSREHDTFLDSWGTTGFAPPINWDDEELQACCAFGLIESDTVWNDKRGGTDLVIHEVGHTLGLAHSFDSISSQNDNPSKNKFWNQYSSPMTYASPPNGCGYIFSLIYSNPCGIADASFTEFERQHMGNMIFTSLVKKTQDNLEKYKTSDEFESQKYNKFKNEIMYSINEFQKTDILSEKSSIKTMHQIFSQLEILHGKIDVNVIEQIQNESAFGNLFLSHDSMVFSHYDTQYLKIFGDVNKKLDGSRVTVLVKDPDEKIDEFRVILSSDNKFQTLLKIDKNTKIGTYEITSKFDDEISNIKIFTINEFEKKLENIVISIDEISDNISKVPTWVKTNAKWWADGSIDEDTFIMGIEFLVAEKIIHVESTSHKSENLKEIPTWVKTNAKWWADGSIDEDTFIMGIEFLVKQGIIKVN